MGELKEGNKRISGYFNPYDTFPAFVYPVFESIGNKTEDVFLQFIGENDEIKHFEKKKLNYDEKRQDTKQYKSGDQAIYAYALSKEEIYFENKENMVKKLKQIEKNYDFLKNEYAYIELLTFVGDYKKAIEVVKQIKNAKNNIIINEWAEDQIKEYTEKMKENNILTCQFINGIKEGINQKVNKIKSIHKNK